jgi:RHS repeat-associated protein
VCAYDECVVLVFTGKEKDIDVGLTYFGKRYLSPYLNRWISADPLAVHVPGKADPNVYAYVSGQALRATDPVGLMPHGEAGAAYDQARHAEGHPTDPGPLESAPAGPPNEMHAQAVATSPPPRAVPGATKEQRWTAAKAGAQNWAVETGEELLWGTALSLLGGERLKFKYLRAPAPSERPTNFKDWELRQQYNFMHRGLSFEYEAGKVFKTWNFVAGGCT